MGPSIMGTAATVAFVGLPANQDAESDLKPLRYTCPLSMSRRYTMLLPTYQG